MKSMKKTIAVAVAVALLVGCAVGGTLAWLIANSGTVTNTFTASDINLTLTETTTNLDNDNNANTNSYKMVPGNTIAKDPKVTVAANSEDCWLFVKVIKSANYDTYLNEYTVASGWTQGDGTNIPSNVYWRQVSAATTDQPFNVLAGATGYENGFVTVKTSVTKAQMEAIKTSGQPTLTFAASAVQQANIPTLTDAWKEVPAEFKNL